MYILFAWGPTTPWFSFFKKGPCVLENPPKLSIGDVFLYLLEVGIMVSAEPFLADTFSYLSNSGGSSRTHPLF